MESQQQQIIKRNKKEKVGIVVSDSMTKTLVVKETQKKRHRKYGKFLTFSKKYTVHDEKSLATLGDEVRIVETRPLSKTKRWKLSDILVKAK